MDNLNWKCIFKNKNRIYFANNALDGVYISDGVNTVWEYAKENVTGCTCNGEMLWLSTVDSNELICVDSQENESFLPVLSYDTVRIVSMVTGQKEIMVLEGLRCDETEILLFDGIKSCVLCKLPIQKEYIDFVIESDEKGFLLCEEPTAVPQRYSDEVDDTEILFFAELAWNSQNNNAHITKSITLYIDNNYDVPQKLSYSENFCFPLFDQYLWKWLKQKSFSSSGKYVVYYSEDIKGIIIGNPVGGKIHRLVSIPEEIADCNSCYYYNDISDELLIITKSNEIKRYIIYCDSEEAIEKLNVAYDDAYNKKRSLSPKHNPGDMTFINILYRAIGSCTCKPLGLSAVGVANRQEVTHHISLTVKTPISGKVLIEKGRQDLGHIDCDNEEFEKTFDFDSEDSTFGIVFLAGSIEKTIYFNSSVNGGNFEIDMQNHLNSEEIIHCCNRTAARRKLQTYPTDMYAIYQLGWVGTEEDLNFLLGIVEDHFLGSSLSYGNGGNRVWIAARTVANLSTRYKRNDAIPLLKAIAETTKNEGMLKIAELIDNCRIDLESHRNFVSYKYRTDILIRTHLIVQVYFNTKDNWVAEIDGSVGFEKMIDWCCVRSNKERNILIVESVYGDQTFDIDIRNNNPYYRQVIDVDPPVFSRELAQEVLKSRGDRILVIPEGIDTLADDFALLFDEKDEKYHFYEIDIPSSVRVIEPLFITKDPGDAWACGKDFDCFDEITVAVGNESFCSVDGVLFTKDMKKLLCYPCGKQAETYTVPEGVETISAFAFQCSQFLEKVNLPSTLKIIEWKAFSFCEKLSEIFLPDGLELIDEDAFEFCNIKHLTLPKSLKKIHWLNLSSTGSGVLNLEIPDSKIEIDMSGYDGCYENPYMPPLFLIKGKNSIFEKYARRHKRNIVRNYYVDETGIVWEADGSGIVEFPIRWSSDVYHIPDRVTSIHRWAFNQSDVKQIIATKDVEIKGNTSGNDFSRLASKDDFRFEHDFFVLANDVEATSIDGVKMGKVIILSGPSAAGKGMVANILVSDNEKYKIAVTATTRTCRAGEVPGETYMFLTNAEFEKGIQEDRFIEYSQYVGNYYGILKESVYSVLKQGKNIILDVDFESALKIKKRINNADTLLVYIMPPDAKTAIERLTIREMNDQNVRNRLAVYAKEAYSALRGDILLINNDAVATAHILASIVDDPKTAKDIYEENVELVVALKKEIEKYLEPSINEEQEFPVEKMMEYFRRFEEYFRRSEEMLGDIKKTGDDTNSKVTSLVHFVETDLQTWISTNRPRIDDEALIEQFAHRATDYINAHVKGSNQKVQEEENHLRNVFDNTWNRLLPSTQSSLISASVLWKLCANISVAGFDYSGIIIAATSALESELKRVFYTDFQTYMVATYGDPSKQTAEKTYAFWPERLLSKTKSEYDKEKSRGSASLPQLADNFTMGTLPYMFKDDKNPNQQGVLRKRMREYLQTIVPEDVIKSTDNSYPDPLKVFNNYLDDNNFVKQCESIRTLYRNPAGHVDVLSRESAEECYTRVVGVGKIDAFRFNHEIQGLIMKLYGYLK